MIDRSLALEKPHRMRDVARTIMPSSVLEARDWERRATRLAALPLPRFYFKRMVAYPTSLGYVNQLKVVIQGLNKRNRLKARLVDPGPMVFTNADRGPAQQQGFPCLSEIQFHRQDRNLTLTVIYRSQYYDTKAYGNFMGLSRVALLAARETNLCIGELIVVATQARLQNVRRIEQVRRQMQLDVRPSIEEAIDGAS